MTKKKFKNTFAPNVINEELGVASIIEGLYRGAIHFDALPDEAKKAVLERIEPDPPNRQDELEKRFHAEYDQAAKHSPTPIFGHWLSLVETEEHKLPLPKESFFSEEGEDGKKEGFRIPYTDITYPFQADSDAEAKAIGNHYAQESIFKIWPDGRTDLI